MKVLVVEDDIEINELLGEYLALENIEYLQATTGQDGVRQAFDSHPDAVILDLMLPDIDGFEVARSLTTHRTAYDIPIVILSCMCQEVDRQKGFSAGALFYMNKPFLPDDLLGTLRQAFHWRESLKDRPPRGRVTFGETDPTVCPRELNQMVADIFSRTDLPDAGVAQIRQAMETLGQWALQWNQGHQAQTKVFADYAITTVNSPGGGGHTSAGLIEWKLSESAPGMLSEAFFRPAGAAQTVGGGGGGGLMGWGGITVAPKIAPASPTAAWLQLLAKTGAARFEKDSTAHTVRFVRVTGSNIATEPCQIPVVEVDGTRYPTRSRDEALAAKKR